MAINKDQYINRELSWLQFNERVLYQAFDKSLPLLERLKFLTITTSNLDEFFMVRVGGLQMMYQAGRKKRDPSGLTPLNQLKAIANEAKKLVESADKCYIEDLKPQLTLAGIIHIPPIKYNIEQFNYLEKLVNEELFPIITPTTIDNSKPVPLLKNLSLKLAVRSKSNSSAKETVSILPINEVYKRLITLPAENFYSYTFIEEVITHFIDKWFPGHEIKECIPFRITRNADIGVREDLAPDLLSGMEDILSERKTSSCIRLEISSTVSKRLLKVITDITEIDQRDIYFSEGPVDLGGFKEIAFMDGFEELNIPDWPPVLPPEIEPKKSMFEIMNEKDLLFCHPYESFDPVVKMIEEAADDPEVLAIKQILYRTSSKSPIIKALKRAAENGKAVTVIIELKARFDEERNIQWARDMEMAGVQVIYGIKNLKTHAKICIIVRREPDGIKKYLHFGTGNYNDSTAKLYSDISYMTTDKDLGSDASAFFNAITGYSEPQNLHKLAMAPIGIRESLVNLIDNEIERKRQGQKALIMAKMNSLVDTILIDKLYEASQAGVEIQLNVRGICCLVPGIKGLSDNITVISIIDRFLEHARIYYFRHGGDPQIFISSADWMPRNLDKRIELLIPIEDKKCSKKLTGILETYFKDNTNSWELKKTEEFKKVIVKKNKNQFRSQEYLYNDAVKSLKTKVKRKQIKFEPHFPQ